MFRELVALAAILFGVNAGRASGPSAGAIKRAVLDDCAQVLSKAVQVGDPMSIGKLGYEIAPPDEEGLWAEKLFGGGRIRIGVDPAKPGCRIRYSGPQATAHYERLVGTLMKQGYAFPDGTRRPAEPQFVLDTLVRERGPIGLISMFRINSAEATMFAVTAYPALPPSRT